MKCTHCHEKEANTHIKRTINGVTQEMYLCEDCAKELGVMDEFAFEPLSMDNFFGNLLGAGVSAVALSREADVVVCFSFSSVCGIDRGLLHGERRYFRALDSG